MDISLKHEEYKVLKANKENSVEECIEAELSLPEYMPEILRIIKTTVEPEVTSCKLLGERITVDGVCELRIVYTAEDGCIYSFSQTRQFTRHCENPAFAEAVDVNAMLDVSYVNCRATGTKRAEIRTGIVVKFNVFFAEKEDIISVDEGCRIEQKCMPIKGLCLGCKKTRAFSMSDTINLSVPSAFLISQKANAVLTEVRKISNKIMLKGEVVVSVCYVNSDNRAQVEHIKHSIPLNQILEIEDLEEHFTGNVLLRVTSLDVLVKGEQNNFASAFDLSLGLEADVTMWEEKEYSVICDAYCIDSAITLDKKPYVFYETVHLLNEAYTCNNSFVVAGEGIESILDVCAEVNGVKTEYKNGELTISGSLCYSIMVRDNTNSLSNINKIFDFSYKHKESFDMKNISCEPQINVVGIKYSVKNSNTIIVDADLSVLGTVLGKLYADTVVALSLSEKKADCPKMPVTVYFTEGENESLWEIARKYNTTVSAIAEENELTGDTTENVKILFIPSA